jgi:hypothetical protein
MRLNKARLYEYNKLLKSVVDCLQLVRLPVVSNRLQRIASRRVLF